MKHILVPVDGSEQSAMAARWASQRALETGGKLTLLHAYNMPAEDAMGLAHLPREEVDGLKQSYGKQSFAAALAAIADDSLVTNSVVVIGKAADEIVAYAKSQGCDHIVMGSRGLSLVRELLLGSVSESVIRRAPCAVTIIR
jgi:nucleotide-binding universal stress UspA family protein